MSLYRKKAVIIEARHYLADKSDGSRPVLAAWCGGQPIGACLIVIPTPEGRMTVTVGDWIIKGVQGEFYPIKDSVFRETYEPAGEPA